MELKKLLGYSLLFLGVVALIQAITSGILGPMNSDFFMVLGVSAVVFVVLFLLFNKKNLKRAISAPKSHKENMTDAVSQMLDENDDIDANVSTDGKLLKGPDWDISLNIKDFHVLRHKKHGAGGITEINIFDTVNRKNIGALRGDTLEGRVRDVIPEVAKILDIISKEKKDVIVAQVPVKEEGKK